MELLGGVGVAALQFAVQVFWHLEPCPEGTEVVSCFVLEQAQVLV